MNLANDVRSASYSVLRLSINQFTIGLANVVLDSSAFDASGTVSMGSV